jgi:putative phosphoribosyl transferase
MATGANMEAAVHAAKVLYHPNEIVVAVPVSSTDAVDRILQHADECLALLQSDTLVSVGQHYVAFPQIEDDEVIAVLQESHRSQVC